VIRVTFVTLVFVLRWNERLCRIVRVDGGGWYGGGSVSKRWLVTVIRKCASGFEQPFRNRGAILLFPQKQISTLELNIVCSSAAVLDGT
jgi:hypothetical protein